MEIIQGILILAAGVAIFLGFPILFWNTVAVVFFGVRDFHATSIWIYLCEFLTVYLIPLIIILLRKVKDNPIVVSVASLVSLVLLVFGFITLRNTINLGRQDQQIYDQWKASILSLCESYPVNAHPAQGEVPNVDRVWFFEHATYSDRDESAFLETYSTPADWNAAVHTIALIFGNYVDSGYEYVDQKTGITTGVRAVRYTWSVSVCDLQNKQRINTTLVGPEPPETITFSQSGGVYGIQPYDQYDAWVATLTGK